MHFGKYSTVDIGNGLKAQQKSLLILARLVVDRGIYDQDVRKAAVKIVSGCPAKQRGTPPEEIDECELRAIYEAVKYGDSRVAGLENGLKYMSDPVAVDRKNPNDAIVDRFVSPAAMLGICGTDPDQCAEDCDSHAALVAALCGSLGYEVGLRAWGPKKPHFEHVYAVVHFPKRNPRTWMGMDTTVHEADFGWEPPGGHTLTAAITDI